MNTGFIFINKPPSWTSHDVIAKLRHITGVQKIGHAGTLDPFATGLLIVGVGREATKQMDKFIKLNKEYVATLCLGKISDTYDPEGTISDFNIPERRRDIDVAPAKEKITKTLEQFLGPQNQIPPMFSAKKVKGKKLYELARQGKEIERKPQQIILHEIELLEYIYPKLKIRVKCSSGTYIRSLGYDIGMALGSGAYLEKLERTKIDKYNLEEAMEIEELNKDNWQNFLKKL